MTATTETDLNELMVEIEGGEKINISALLQQIETSDKALDSLDLKTDSLIHKIDNLLSEIDKKQ
jgi:ACT domain-containing protein